MPWVCDVIAIKRPERAKALFTAAITLLPFQGVPASSAYKPRVSLRSALGYVLLAPSGRSFQPYRSKNIVKMIGFLLCSMLCRPFMAIATEVKKQSPTRLPYRDNPLIYRDINHFKQVEHPIHSSLKRFSVSVFQCFS